MRPTRCPALPKIDGDEHVADSLHKKVIMSSLMISRAWANIRLRDGDAWFGASYGTYKSSGAYHRSVELKEAIKRQQIRGYIHYSFRQASSA